MGQVNGNLLNGIGGYVEVKQYAQVGDQYLQRLDITEWMVRHQWYNVDATHTGCYGAINMRRVAVGWTFACEVVWDLNQHHPKALLQSCNSIGLVFNVGNPVEGQYPPGFNQADKQMFYYSPSALLDEIITVNNNSKDVVRLFCKGTGSSHLFLRGPFNDENAQMQTYQTYLANRGWSG